ncbi:MAG: DNA replication/repair protein RecF [Spirochaetales bacterium]|nr:DNA replication/repair protein RecF [Spirochaetales bacterium]
MGFIYVQFYNFRNLKNEKIPTEAEKVFLIGENGQGKTNFLEALYCLCFGVSFRTKKNQYMIKNETDACSLKARIVYDTCEKDVDVRLFRRKDKEIRVDGSRIIDRKEMVHMIPCIIFAHDDMTFIQGPPERKRFFINQTISLIKTDFIEQLREYSKIIKNRNCCLKKKQFDLVSVYDEKLAICGLGIQTIRKKVIEEFNGTFSSLFGLISGMNVPASIVYKPSWKEQGTKENILDLLRKNRKKEAEYGMTISGPHRDQLYFEIGNRDVVSVASTGQIRLLSLILRTAQSWYCYKKTGKKPVLLIDDVLLELDLQKRSRFYDNLRDFEQIFFTFLPDESFIKRSGTNIIKYFIHDGAISQWNGQATY